MGNNVQMLFSSILPVLGLIQGGKLKPIALAADKRSPLLPNVPTFAEGGIDYKSSTWFGLLAPAKTPAAIQPVSFFPDMLMSLNPIASLRCE
jgi:tripartite-type tricarboxylate transporter receptor subunit TctC